MLFLWWLENHDYFCDCFHCLPDLHRYFVWKMSMTGTLGTGKISWLRNWVIMKSLSALVGIEYNPFFPLSVSPFPGSNHWRSPEIASLFWSNPIWGLWLVQHLRTCGGGPKESHPRSQSPRLRLIDYLLVNFDISVI